ncbi:MAG TPA: hypothetical protein VL361_19615 [Candidatus Limnocylindrales bacterium]|jgi:hypothetical protein|nr:hypothetical protein [Candidatus Limnocylindrales bacterium]
MNKLIVILAVAGLMATGCASRKNQGGVSNENNPSYGTGTTENSGAMENNTGKGAENLKNGNAATNPPISTIPEENKGGATTPGGIDSGANSSTSPDLNGTQKPDSGSNPTPDQSGTKPTPDQSGSNPTPDQNGSNPSSPQ